MRRPSRSRPPRSVRALGHYLRFHAPHRSDRFWLENGVALGITAALAVCIAWRGRLARTVHVAVILPVAHLAAVLIAWTVWRRIADAMPQAHAWAPSSRSMPAIEVAAIAGAWLVICAAIEALRSRRVVPLVRTVMVGALVALVAFGLWLPLAAQLWQRAARWTAEFDLVIASDLTLQVIVPPLVIAVVAAIAIQRWPATVHRARGSVLAIGGAALAVALCCRIDVDPDAALIYSNFVPVVMAAAVFAVLSIVAVAIALVIARARSRALFAGPTVTGTLGGATRPAPDVHVRVEIATWLSGPRVVADRFVVVTPAGRIQIPRGAEIVAPIPAITTHLATGEATALLVAGDRVRIAGFVDPPADHPYRRVDVPVPGTRGIFVAPVGGERGGRWSDVALAMWRPCVCYLMAMAVTGAIAVAPAVETITWLSGR